MPFSSWRNYKTIGFQTEIFNHCLSPLPSRRFSIYYVCFCFFSWWNAGLFWEHPPPAHPSAPILVSEWFLQVAQTWHGWTREPRVQQIPLFQGTKQFLSSYSDDMFFFEKVIQYRWIRPLPSSNLIWLWKITMQCLIGNSSVIRAIFHSYVELLEGDLIFPEFVAIFMAKMMMVWREQYPEGGLTNEGDYFPTSCKKGWWGKYEENRNGIGPWFRVKYRILDKYIYSYI